MKPNKLTLFFFFRKKPFPPENFPQLPRQQVTEICAEFHAEVDGEDGGVFANLLHGISRKLSSHREVPDAG